MANFEELRNFCQQEANAFLPVLMNWCKISSHTMDASGLEKLRLELEYQFRDQGKLEVLEINPAPFLDEMANPGRKTLGKALRIRKSGNKSVFLGIHYDTVHQKTLPVQLDREKRTLTGAGVIDAKGGIAVLYLALQALREFKWAKDLGWEILLNPDEEIGSPGSLALIQEAAARNFCGLLFEPALSGGKIASRRKGSGNFDFVFKGKSAHAGRNLQDGINSVEALSRFVVELVEWGKEHPGILINPAKVTGGGALNVVPDLAILGCNIRVESNEQMQLVEKELKKRKKNFQNANGIRVEIYGGFLSPPKPWDSETQDLANLAKIVASELDLDLEFQSTGGVCDGNKLAAFGCPNLDTMGVCGKGIHSEDETLYVDSLGERSALTAGILAQLAKGKMEI